MKRINIIFVWVFFAITTSVTLYATCPQTDCAADSGDCGSSCTIVQYDEYGNVCSITTCYGRRGGVN